MNVNANNDDANSSDISMSSKSSSDDATEPLLHQPSENYHRTNIPTKKEGKSVKTRIDRVHNSKVVDKKKVVAAGGANVVLVDAMRKRLGTLEAEIRRLHVLRSKLQLEQNCINSKMEELSAVVKKE